VIGWIVPRKQDDNTSMTECETLPNDPFTAIKHWILTPAESDHRDVLLADLPFKPAVIRGSAIMRVLYTEIDLQTSAGLELAASQALDGQQIDLPEHEYLLNEYPNLCRYLKSAAMQSQTGYMLAARKDHLTSHTTEMSLWIYDYRPGSILPDSAMYYAVDQGLFQGCDYWLRTRPTLYTHTISSIPANKPPAIPPMFEYNQLLYPGIPGES
jgi:hypothetical protein